MKLCECGCGEAAPLSTVTRASQGLRRGEPRRFVNGHSARRRGPDYREEDRGHATPCWIWLGATATNGYGRKQDGNGRVGQAHRVYYERIHGPIPAGLHLDHLCKVPLCVNPEHLEPVTNAENVRRGDKTKLTHSDVAVIHGAKGVESSATLATRFGVTRKTIQRIWAGTRWGAV